MNVNDLIERLNDAWRKLYGDGDEHDVCDTIAEAAAALEAAREDAARWRFVAQFMRLDDVGDDQYCLGLIVNYEALEDMVTAQSARLDDERRRLEWADVQGPEDSPKTLPPITLDAAIDAAIDQARGKAGQEVGE
jgi:hypothetical protein